MNRSHTLLHSLLIALALLWPLNRVLADNDHLEARRLLNAGKILPLETILEHARQKHPGRILELELDKENGRIIYEIEILGNDGVVRDIHMDASTGEVLSGKEDD